MSIKELLLVRHGEAMAASDNPERPLAAQGLSQARRTAAILGDVNGQIDVIYHSSKKRAEETAEILATSIESRNGVRWRSGLNPNDPVADILAELDDEDVERIMIVGHMPFLSRLASLLLSGRPDPPVVDFGLASAAAFARESDSWKLRWMVDPTEEK